MEPLISTLMFLLHIALVILLFIGLVQSFGKSRINANPKQKTRHKLLEVGLMALLLFCFIYKDLSGFEHQPYFTEFTVITLIAVFFFWISKITPIQESPLLHTITLVFISSLFWLSAFTVFKFYPYLPYVWFPLLGLLALGPFYIALLSLSELLYQLNSSQKSFHLAYVFSGLVPLLIVQLIMNTYTPQPWEFIRLFQPVNF